MDIEKIETEILNTFEDNSLKQVNETLYLTGYQMNVLNEAHIPYQTCSNVKDILFLLNDIVDEEEYDEIDEVARQLSEFSYYEETHK